MPAAMVTNLTRKVATAVRLTTVKVATVLIDIRHEPGKNDRQMYEWMTAQGYFPIIIATKMDKLKRSQIEKHVKMIREGLDAPQETIVIPFSAMTKQGREEIYALLDDMLKSFAEDEPLETQPASGEVWPDVPSISAENRADLSDR